MALHRELGLISTILYGVGIILGAGIYALIGVGAGIAGNMLWFAFLLASIIAVFTGLSYAELSSIFPKTAAEYHYTKKAFKNNTLSFFVGWILVAGTIIAAATVSLGFAGYFTTLFGGDPLIVSFVLIFVMSALNYIGIKESASFNNLASIIEVFGLLLVVLVFLFFPTNNSVDLFELPPGGFVSIFGAVGIIFFAYIGFENIVNLSEEVKDSKKNIPKALIISLLISTILYIVVSIAAVEEVGASALLDSKAPLTLVVSRAFGDFSNALSYIALFATGNTVLIFLIASSRILYGMSKAGSLPKLFSLTNSHGTPMFSILACGVVCAIISFSGDIELVAKLTDFGVFIAYFAVNASLIALAGKKLERGFISPRFFNIPIFAWFGLFASLIMILTFDPFVWLLESLVLIVGLTLKRG